MQRRAHALSLLVHWLPLAAAICIGAGLVMAIAQLNFRTSLNDPQVEMVGNAVYRLEHGATPQELVSATGLDASYSLSPFLAVYDKDGNPLAWSMTLNGGAPKPPVGVFEYAKRKGGNRVTWQPGKTTRIALVVRPVGDGSSYVASGRNMAEEERRLWIMSRVGFAALLLMLLVTLLFEVLGDWWRKRILTL